MAWGILLEGKDPRTPGVIAYLASSEGAVTLIENFRVSTMAREVIREYAHPKVAGLWRRLLVTAPCVLLCAAEVQSREIKPLPLDPFCIKALANSWAVVPRGLQQLDDVPFEINGYIELASSRAGPRRVLPIEAAGIEVGKKFSRMHLLHCAEYYDRSGAPLEDLVLYYADGQRYVATLVYGVHAQDWYDYAGDRRGLVQDANSRVAWKGTSDDAAKFGKIVRLYHTTLDNPRPDQVVT